MREAIGPGRVGIRIDPLGHANGIADAVPSATYSTLSRGLSNAGFAYFHAPASPGSRAGHSNADAGLLVRTDRPCRHHRSREGRSRHRVADHRCDCHGFIVRADEGLGTGPAASNIGCLLGLSRIGARGDAGHSDVVFEVVDRDRGGNPSDAREGFDPATDQFVDVLDAREEPHHHQIVAA